MHKKVGKEKSFLAIDLINTANLLENEGKIKKQGKSSNEAGMNE